MKLMHLPQGSDYIEAMTGFRWHEWKDPILHAYTRAIVPCRIYGFCRILRWHPKPESLPSPEGLGSQSS
jgi:hypothetical protein